MGRMLLTALGALWLASAVVAAPLPPLPYDDAADPHVALSRALSEAKQSKKEVLVVFGANWCEDCRDLDQAMRGTSAPLLDARFVVVKVNVGNFDKNLDLDKRLGDPIRRGIPAAVILAPDSRLLYSTKAGELANAHRMGSDGIYRFFAKILKKYPTD